tara:strand:+ start:200 stop:1318 length:1119 start_codon:yes stop_codon:yes gene_type:complete
MEEYAGDFTLSEAVALIFEDAREFRRRTGINKGTWQRVEKMLALLDLEEKGSKERLSLLAKIGQEAQKLADAGLTPEPTSPVGHDSSSKETFLGLTGAGAEAGAGAARTSWDEGVKQISSRRPVTRSSLSNEQSQQNYREFGPREDFRYGTDVNNDLTGGWGETSQLFSPEQSEEWQRITNLPTTTLEEGLEKRRQLIGFQGKIFVEQVQQLKKKDPAGFYNAWSGDDLGTSGAREFISDFFELVDDQISDIDDEWGTGFERQQTILQGEEWKANRESRRQEAQARRDLERELATQTERSSLIKELGRLSLETAKSAIPPSLVGGYVPGFEPGGPMEASYRKLGLTGFKPERITGVRPDYSRITQELARLGG